MKNKVSYFFFPVCVAKLTSLSTDKPSIKYFVFYIKKHVQNEREHTVQQAYLRVTTDNQLKRLMLITPAAVYVRHGSKKP